MIWNMAGNDLPSQRLFVYIEFPAETTTAAKPTYPPTEKTTDFPTDFPPDTDEYSQPYPDLCEHNITHVCVNKHHFVHCYDQHFL